MEDHCPDCAQPGKLRAHTVRRLVDLPFVGFPTRLHVRVPRLTCSNPVCSRKIFQASLNCANDGPSSPTGTLAGPFKALRATG
ncbi:MAG: transposase family protein [Corynebacterium sp.]|uniref:transposase family protein n=1 Tax=Corynebacterium sp. TaxID=1720 RepID=UPI0026E0B844|nr:transposase family protein [Corynebacterium sp.]MDO5669163.1 transposase family protein [Corynebacterium sp.]